jgi:uncharacterized SAM-binding protein YcdF (DUF218 family)
MFFIASKTLGFFALPSNVLITLGLIGVVLLPTRFARAGQRLMAAALVLLALAGFSPLGNILLLPLEQRFPAWNGAGGAPAGIIVLGGAINPAVSDARGTVALNEAGERMTAAVELARRYPQARLFFSGGDGGLRPGAVVEAQFARPLWESLGIAADRVQVEGRSRNTAENAAVSKEYLHPAPGERWLLVTSANHMPRAIGCFRKAGFAVEAYPVDWRTRGPQDRTELFDQFSAGVARTDAAVHEWVGLVAYWLSGRTSALWPGP